MRPGAALRWSKWTEPSSWRALIIYFPVATTFGDGLNRAAPTLIELARLNGAGRWQTLRLIRFPLALPALGSGLKVAAVAPIGAIVGEWIGAAGGLGFIMLQANARMQTDRVFVALVLLARRLRTSSSSTSISPSLRP